MPRKVTPNEDMEAKTFVYDDEVFELRKRFKVGRFLKTVTSDPATALEIVMTEDSYERFLDLEMDMEKDFSEFLTAMTSALTGEKAGN